MSRRGLNPCLVCATDTLGPKGGVVCSECRRKVEGYEELRDAIKARTATISIRYYPFVPGRSHGEKGKYRARLDTLLRELRGGLGEMPSGPYGTPLSGERHETTITSRVQGISRNWSSGSDYGLRRAPLELAQVIADLDDAIYLAIEEAIAEGKDSGTNLLAQLASGALTSPEFERKAGISKEAAR